MTGTAKIAAPFRADQVGSLRRPDRLREAKGDEIKALQDECIRDAVRMQETVGLTAVTDGEFRRGSWHNFLENLEGVEVVPAVIAPGSKTFRPRSYRIDSKLRHTRPIEVDAFAYLNSITDHVAKVTMVSPTMLMRAGRDGVSQEAYPDLDELYDDVAAVFRAEIEMLFEAGCRYLQIDDTNFIYLCDPSFRDQFNSHDPQAAARRYVTLLNKTIGSFRDRMAITVHMCRGNSGGAFSAQGGYEPIADVLLNELNVDGFFLEYDTERAGGFEPLRFLEKGSAKKVVLGLVSSKHPVLESKDAVKRRIDQATEFVPIENLCLSPQCGFGSNSSGAPTMSEDEQRRKLSLVVETAHDVWGTAS